MKTATFEQQIDELETELAEVHNALRPLWDRQFRLENELTRLRSLVWIRSNGATKDNTELSSGKGKPYFGVVHAFTVWLQSNSTKPFAEWSGRVYKTQELVEGTASLGGPARAEDLQ